MKMERGEKMQEEEKSEKKGRTQESMKTCGESVSRGMTAKNKATFFAFSAALLYGMNVPISKLLLSDVEPVMMAAFLYLGAGLGMAVLRLCGDMVKRKKQVQCEEEPFEGRELPYLIGMVLLDIAAPILLMYGMRLTTSAGVSLLSNFEIVATALIALAIFGEKVSKRLWLAIAMITLGSIVLSFDGSGEVKLNAGSLMVLGATVCWGFENNCTRKLSNKSSTQIVIVKGIFSGLGSFITALATGAKFPELRLMAAVLTLGFVSYGLGIKVYILAQKDLGAAKTSAYYASAPFIGVLLSFAVLGERPGLQFAVGLVFMIASTVLIIKDTIGLQHTHAHAHIHEHVHSHGELVHSHPHSHIHSHQHAHGSEGDESGGHGTDDGRDGCDGRDGRKGGDSVCVHEHEHEKGEWHRHDGMGDGHDGHSERNEHGGGETTCEHEHDNHENDERYRHECVREDLRCAHGVRAKDTDIPHGEEEGIRVHGARDHHDAREHEIGEHGKLQARRQPSKIRSKSHETAN